MGVLLDTTTMYYLKNSDSLCSSQKVIITVFADQASLLPFITGDSTICSGDSLLLSGNSTVNTGFNWTGPQGFSSTDQVISFEYADISMSGNYFLQVSDSLCTSPAASVFIEIFSKPEVEIFSDDTAFCDGDSTVIYTLASFSQYDWYSSGDIAPAVTVTNSGNYFLVVSDSNGCRDTSGIMNITRFPVTPVPLVNDTAICLDSSVTLPAIADGVVYWYDNSMQLLDSGNYFTTPLLTGDATYLINQVAGNGCYSANDSAEVKISPLLPPPLLVTNSPVCEGESLFFYVDTFQNATYSWTSAGFSSPYSFNDFERADTLNNGNYLLHYFYLGCDNGTVSFDIICFPI